MIGPISVGVVTAHDPVRHGVIVSLRTSGNVPGMSIKVGMDVADGLRVSQRPLPALGTRGIIAFPYGDNRNGVWLCSYFPTQVDAITESGDALDPYLDYESTFSGFWRLLDGQGQFAAQFPDGSSFVVGTASGLPTVYRHTVGSGQVQQRIPFTFGDRVSKPPPAYKWTLTTADGISVKTNGASGVTVSAPGGGSITLTVSGTTLAVASGGVTVTGNLTVTGDTSFGGGAKKVVLDGDPVIGGGGGNVQATSTTIKAT